MEFKEVIKTRRRICNYYIECNDCPLFKSVRRCRELPFDKKEIDEYEKILEEWAKEHPVMTNADKHIEVMKNTFGEDVDKTVIRESCIGNSLGIECIKDCSECLKWWDEEYKEPEKEGKANEQI